MTVYIEAFLTLTRNAAQNLNSQNLTNVDIDSGTMAGVTLDGALNGGSQSITNIGNATSQLLVNAWTLAGAGEQKFRVDSSGDQGIIEIDSANVAGKHPLLEFQVAGGFGGFIRVNQSTGDMELQSQTVGHSVAMLSNLEVIDGYIELDEMAAPGAGVADTVRIYAFLGGGALTDLCAVFQDATVDCFAQEVTAPGDAVIAAPDETVGTVVIKRPHPGTVQLVVRVPGFDDWNISEKEFHNEEKISWSGNSEKTLPVDWYTESDLEMAARQSCENVWDRDTKTCISFSQ